MTLTERKLLCTHAKTGPAAWGPWCTGHIDLRDKSGVAVMTRLNVKQQGAVHAGTQSAVLQ